MNWANPRHQQAARNVDQPQPGLFKVQLEPRGPWYAARITHAPACDPDTGEALDRSYFWTAEIDGDVLADPCPDWLAARVQTIWEHGVAIDRAEYDALIARSREERRPLEFKPLTVED